MKRTAYYAITLLGALTASLHAAPTSRKAEVTCDFRPVAEAKTGYAALGKLKFDINLDKKTVPVKCLSDECVLDGEERTINLSSVLEPTDERPLFSKDDMPRMVLYGSNGDDTDFLVILNGDNRGTLTLMIDSNISQSTTPVECKVDLK